MKKIISLLFFVLIALSLWYVYKNYLAGTVTALLPASQDISELIPSSKQKAKETVNETQMPLSLPEGAKISIYAKGLETPRDLIIDPNGHLIASIPQQQRVAVFNAHGNLIGLVNELKNPHGIALNCSSKTQCTLYIAEEHQVVSYTYHPDKYTLANKKILFELPQGGRHTSRSLLVSGESLYISIGSSCDACEENDSRRGTVYVSDLDGTDLRPFATGLRNSVFLTNRPGKNEIWATEMGRDFLGNDLPPDEINILRKGGFYGWPFCYGNNVVDTRFEDTIRSRKRCDSSIASQIDLPAHSAPLGLLFVDQNTLLVAYHGSWNRTPATGYKIMKFNLDDGGREIGREEYISGWLTSNGEVLGRPVDMVMKDDGSLYISDDKAGVIYLVEF